MAHLLGLIAAAAAGYFTYDYFTSDFGEIRIHWLIAFAYNTFGEWGPTTVAALAGYLIVYGLMSGLFGDKGGASEH